MRSRNFLNLISIALCFFLLMYSSLFHRPVLAIDDNTSLAPEFYKLINVEIIGILSNKFVVHPQDANQVLRLGSVVKFPLKNRSLPVIVRDEKLSQQLEPLAKNINKLGGKTSRSFHHESEDYVLDWEMVLNTWSLTYGQDEVFRKISKKFAKIMPIDNYQYHIVTEIDKITDMKFYDTKIGHIEFSTEYSDLNRSKGLIGFVRLETLKRSEVKKFQNKLKKYKKGQESINPEKPHLRATQKDKQGNILRKSKICLFNITSCMPTAF